MHTTQQLLPLIPPAKQTSSLPQNGHGLSFGIFGSLGADANTTAIAVPVGSVPMFGSTTRGNIVTFSAVPLDQNGAPTTPVSVTMTVTYFVLGQSTQMTLSMTQNAGTWTATWDSSFVQPEGCNVYWSMQASTPKAAASGMFTVIGTQDPET